MDHHRQIGRGLLGGDAELLHFLRQTRRGASHAVLHLDLGLVQIGAQREGRGQGQIAIGGRLGIHVQHAFDAGDFLFQRRGHGGADDLRVGARIVGAHYHGGWHDFGILGDGQLEQRQQAADDDQDRQHRGEDRALDEETGDVHERPPAA